ncbi:MAG TPA: alternative ribosome rescue aminoacyl-tRNA hydrolase ArfB [Anaerolineales bacterium]|nr:alternative ribosome rescue aminoacyl-tRNA hydrolase ArfB [Anaerolineales bacterium]
MSSAEGSYTVAMLEITPTLKLDERELQFTYIRASGPGGQNVNKVATAVQLRFNLQSSALPEDMKVRLKKLAGDRLSKAGILTIEARRFRTQERNREDALQRLITLLRKAAVEPRTRKETKPTYASKEKRLREKKKRGEIKKSRQAKVFD